MWTRLATLGGVLLLSYGYFYEGGGWNQNTRFDLTRAIVEEGTLRIDDYWQNSGDLARLNGHVYSDKAPGASLTAVPAVMVARRAVILSGHSTASPRSIAWLSWVATFAVGALPAMLASLCLFGLALRMGAGENLAALVALAYGLATPLWAYATLFWGHALAAGCVMTALLAADLLRDEPLRPWHDVAYGAVIGLAAGWAVVTEYPSVLPALVLTVLAIGTVWRTGRLRALRVGLALAAGASLCAAVLMIYQWAAFGSPFHLGYESHENPELLKNGFFGITIPKLDVVGELLWGSYRGLLPLAPVLLVTPVGLWMLWRKPGTRWIAVAAVVIVLFYFGMNSAYEHWEGGASYGPRHLAVALGFLCLGLVPVLMRGGRIVRGVVVALILAGATQSLVGVSTTPQPPSDLPGIQFHHPMGDFLWPEFMADQLSLNRQSFLDPLPLGPDGPRAAWNVGEKIGLSGRASLVPLFAVWLLAGLLWRMFAPQPVAVVPVRNSKQRRRTQRRS